MLVQGWSWRYREPGRRSRSGERSRPGGEGGHNHLRSRWPITQGRMRAHAVVTPPPALDDDPGLLQGVKDLPIQQFISQPGIERLHIPVLPRRAWGNVRRLGSHRRNPPLHGFGHELGTIVGTDVARHAAQDEQVREHVDDVDGLELAIHPDGQALVREFIDHIEHPELAAVMGAVLAEVIRPHVIAILGPQPDAGPVRQPQPPALGLLRRYLEPLAAPDPLDPLVVHQPAGVSEECADLAVAIAAVLARQLDQVGGELFFVLVAPRRFALGRAVLPERATGATLGDVQHVPDMLDTGASTRGAQKFPLAASCRISLSSVRSAMALRRRWFSVSRAFMRLTWSDFRPPYSWRQR